METVRLLVMLFRNGQGRHLLSDQITSGLVLVACQRPASWPKRDPWDFFVFEGGLGCELDIKLVVHTESFTISVVDGDIHPRPVGWDVLNCSVWIHPANRLQMQGLFSKDRVFKHDPSKVAGVVRPHAFVPSSIAHQLLRFELFVPSGVGVAGVLDFLLEELGSSWHRVDRVNHHICVRWLILWLRPYARLLSLHNTIRSRLVRRTFFW